MIKLLLLDEQKNFKTGLTGHFQNENNIHILETQNNIHQELEKLFNLSPAQLIDEIYTIQPDVVLVDPFYNNSNRLPFIKKLLKKLPHLKIVILSNSKEYIYLSEARILGVKAFLMKTDTFSEILKCVISVANGYNDYHLKMMKEETNRTQKELAQTKSILFQSLNSIEYDVLKLLSQGKKIIEIASIMNISERTTYRIKKSMMCKLDIKFDCDLFRFFL